MIEIRHSFVRGGGEPISHEDSLDIIRLARLGLWAEKYGHSVLSAAKEKLALYRSEHSGEYKGGMEYTVLNNWIEEALKAFPKKET